VAIYSWKEKVLSPRYKVRFIGIRHYYMDNNYTTL